MIKILCIIFPLLLVSCKFFDKTSSQLKKLSYEESYKVEYIMDYDKDCTVGKKFGDNKGNGKIRSAACARAATRYCSKKFKDDHVGYPISMSRIGLTLACLKTEKNITYSQTSIKREQAYGPGGRPDLRVNNDKSVGCSIKDDFNSRSCQEFYQDQCKKELDSTNRGRYNFAAFVSDVSGNEVSISCVKTSQKLDLPSMKSLVEDGQCKADDLTSEACRSELQTICLKQGNIGVPRFTSGKDYSQGGGMIVDCVNAVSHNEKLFATRIGNNEQVAECLYEANTGVSGMACMGDIDALLGFDPFYLIGSSYLGSQFGKYPRNGMDGTIYVDWTFSERQRHLIKDALKIYNYWIGSEELKECSSKYAVYGPGFDDDVRSFFDDLSREKSNLFVYRVKREDSKSSGFSELKSLLPLAQKNELKVALNTAHMSSDYDVGYHPAYWAGVILHQVTQSQGYLHPITVHPITGADIQRSSFAKVNGECIQSLEESRSGAGPVSEGAIPLDSSLTQSFLCPVRAYQETELIFNISGYDVRDLNTVGKKDLTSACFQEDRHYSKQSLMELNFDNKISRLVIDPGYEVCLYKKEQGRERPDCCYRKQDSVKFYDIFKHVEYANNVSGVVISPRNGKVPDALYESNKAPSCPTNP